MRKILRVFHPSYLIPLVLVYFLGCAGPRTQLMEKVRGEMYQSRADAAYQTYRKKVKNTQRVDELLNLGLLAFEAKDYAACQQALTRADQLAEERLTKSLSREAAAVAVSDRLRAYQGTVFDKAMIHYYRALAYLAEGKTDEAVVEGRRVASYLEVNARESKHTYKDDAFLQWFNGALYDHAGQVNDAWISYKRARELYPRHYGLSEPTYLAAATLGAARAMHDTTQERELDSLCFGTELRSDFGRVVVLCETGLAPPIRETNIVFPILETDRTQFASEDERDRFYYNRYQSCREYGTDYDETHLKYLVRVALPYYEENAVGSAVTRVSVRDETNECHCAELSEDVGRILQQDLKDRYPSIVARAVVRAMIKYAATEAAKEAAKKEDKKENLKDSVLSGILGAVFNTAAVASEAADTRSWETLPDKIYAADFQLSPGPHEVTALFEDDAGAIVLRHDFGEVNVKPGEVVFLRARCMQ